LSGALSSSKVSSTTIAGIARRCSSIIAPLIDVCAAVMFPRGIPSYRAGGRSKHLFVAAAHTHKKQTQQQHTNTHIHHFVTQHITTKQVYKSSLNQASQQLVCGAAILPLKTKVKGPAPPHRGDGVDIVDEGISTFRANVLFKNFAEPGPADLVMCYLTVYISECLRLLAMKKTKSDGMKTITQLSLSGNFSIPGDAGFPLAGFFKSPGSRRDADDFRAYFRQLREETSTRLLERVYNGTSCNL
jgi:actin related protein 2/3 complex subunit 3